MVNPDLTLRAAARMIIVALMLAFGFGAFTFVATEAASAQVTPLEDDSEDAPGLGEIIGSPEAGPEPEDAGDRGGYAQLTLAVALFVAIGVIVGRIVLATRARTTES